MLTLGTQAMTGIFPRPGEAVESGPLDLLKCEGPCGLVQLGQSYDPIKMYGGDYGYRSGLNRTMVEHLRKKAWELSRDLKPGSVVLDVGSNDGTFLGFVPRGCERIGVDPTIAKFGHLYEEGIVKVPTFFSAELGAKADLITSIACFYDLEDPVQFARDVYESLAPGGHWHFEQSYLPRMMSQRAYDTVCHEHLEYYSYKPIAWILNEVGFEVVRVEENEVNGGSIAITVRKGTKKTEGSNEPSLEDWRQFRGTVERHRSGLLSVLNGLHADGKCVIGLGASTKGNVILQYCGIGPDLVECIGEVNPDKLGRVTPGTNIPIVTEQDAFARKPDVALILPWHFKESMVERYRHWGCELLFPLPTLHYGQRRLV